LLPLPTFHPQLRLLLPSSARPPTNTATIISSVSLRMKLLSKPLASLLLLSLSTALTMSLAQSTPILSRQRLLRTSKIGCRNLLSPFLTKSAVKIMRYTHLAPNPLHTSSSTHPVNRRKSNLPCINLLLRSTSRR
jgi:hypothetical protein